MTGREVIPGPARGSVRAPPSKSYTHRALLAAHLARRRAIVEAPLDADDTRATARAIAAMGSRVVRDRRRWTVEPTRSRGGRTVDCGASGTTLRFATAVAALRPQATTFTGAARLGRRPMSELLRALRALGAECRPAGAEEALPLTVRGPIDGGRVELDASESSQFVSALLLALPTCRRSSTVRLRGRIVSAPYIDATRAVLAHHGVQALRRGRAIQVPGHQTFSGTRLRVPGDASSAAYLWAAAAVSGGDVQVRDVPRKWPQADLAILGLLRRFGAHVVRSDDSVRVRAGELRPFSVDLTDCPDLYPLAGVLAACAPGTSRLRGAAHVVLKESDRKAGTAQLARALGASVRSRSGSLEIHGTAEPRAIRFEGQDDHRMVMSAAVGALAGPTPSRVGDPGAVAKSFPEFWTVLDRLTGGRAGA